MKQEGSDIVFNRQEALLCGIASFPLDVLPQVYAEICAKRDAMYNAATCSVYTYSTYSQRGNLFNGLGEKLVTTLTEIMIEEIEAEHRKPSE